MFNFLLVVGAVIAGILLKLSILASLGLGVTVFVLAAANLDQNGVVLWGLLWAGVTVFVSAVVLFLCAAGLANGLARQESATDRLLRRYRR